MNESPPPPHIRCLPPAAPRPRISLGRTRRSFRGSPTQSSALCLHQRPMRSSPQLRHIVITEAFWSASDSRYAAERLKDTSEEYISAKGEIGGRVNVRSRSDMVSQEVPPFTMVAAGAPAGCERVGFRIRRDGLKGSPARFRCRLGGRGRPWRSRHKRNSRARFLRVFTHPRDLQQLSMFMLIVNRFHMFTWIRDEDVIMSRTDERSMRALSASSMSC
jgi:hypothetical protein